MSALRGGLNGLDVQVLVDAQWLGGIALENSSIRPRADGLEEQRSKVLRAWRGARHDRRPPEAIDVLLGVCVWMIRRQGAGSEDLLRGLPDVGEFLPAALLEVMQHLRRHDDVERSSSYGIDVMEPAEYLGRKLFHRHRSCLVELEASDGAHVVLDGRKMLPEPQPASRRSMAEAGFACRLATSPKPGGTGRG